MITVHNKDVANLKVAINKWADKNGNADYFQILSGENESWNRENDNGYVMSVKIKDGSGVENTKNYYVKPGYKVEISPGCVKGNGVELTVQTGV